MKERWDDDDDDDVMTRSQPQLPPGRPCHALLWLPAGGSEEPELTSDGLMRAGGGRWGAGGGPAGKAVIWCNELWLWLSVPAQLFPGEHLQHIQVTSTTISTIPSTTTNNNNCSVCVSDIKVSPSFNIIFFCSSLASQWFRQLFLWYKYWGWNEMTLPVNHLFDPNGGYSYMASRFLHRAHMLLCAWR